jgi:hypothetical protein
MARDLATIILAARQRPRQALLDQCRRVVDLTCENGLENDWAARTALLLRIDWLLVQQDASLAGPVHEFRSAVDSMGG